MRKYLLLSAILLPLLLTACAQTAAQPEQETPAAKPESAQTEQTPALTPAFQVYELPHLVPYAATREMMYMPCARTCTAA